MLTPTPLTIVDPSLTSPGQHILTSITWSQHKLLPYKRLEEGKDIIVQLTVEAKRIALYRGMAPKRLDHYVDYLTYMVDEKKLNAMCEDANFMVMLSRLLYEVSITLSFYLLNFSLYFSHIEFCFHHFQIQLIHGLNRVRVIEKWKPKFEVEK